MLYMKAFYCDHFVLPLPPDHRFPMRKYALLRERVIEAGFIAPEDLREPPPATDAELLRAHAAAYIEKVKHGELTGKEIRRMGFPWSPQLVERSRRSVGGTLSACRAALHDGVSANLAGGTHHAAADFGAGFCVFNDVAVAALAMRAEQRAARIVILDCDVHQGDGTAAILADVPEIFTFSIHGAHNFPFRKQQSDLDIELDNNTADDAYLDALQYGIDTALALANADLAIYVAGADPYSGDRLGKLAVSKAGLAARDQYVLAACCTRGIPVAVVMGGGYARNLDDLVDIHLQTLEIAAGWL